MLGFPRTITIFPPALLALLIPNTTANHTITYTNSLPIEEPGTFQEGRILEDQRLAVADSGKRSIGVMECKERGVNLEHQEKSVDFEYEEIIVDLECEETGVNLGCKETNVHLECKEIGVKLECKGIGVNLECKRIGVNWSTRKQMLT